VLRLPRRLVVGLDYFRPVSRFGDSRGGLHKLTCRRARAGSPFGVSPSRKSPNNQREYGQRRMCGSGQRPESSPGARWHYRQNRHQGRLPGSSARTANNRCNSEICWSLLASCSRSISITVPLSLVSSGFPCSSSSSTSQRNPCGVDAWRPVSTPLSNRRRTVGMLMCRWAAASEIVISMVNRLPVWVINCVGGGYPNLYRFPSVEVGSV